MESQNNNRTTDYERAKLIGELNENYSLGTVMFGAMLGFAIGQLGDIVLAKLVAADELPLTRLLYILVVMSLFVSHAVLRKRKAKRIMTELYGKDWQQKHEK